MLFRSVLASLSGMEVVMQRLFCIGLVAIAMAADDPPKTLEEFNQRVIDRYSKLTEAERIYVDTVRNGKPIESVAAIFFGQRDVVVTLSESLKVSQVLDEQNAIVTTGKRDFVLRGVSTKDLADGSGVKLKGVPLVICETYSFTTVLGATRTLPLIQAVNTSAAERSIADAYLQQRSRDFASVGPAAFIELKEGVVKFTLLDNKTVQRKMIDLPERDKEWVRKFAAEERKANSGR